MCAEHSGSGSVINKNHIIISMERSQEESLFERLITSYYEKRNIPKHIICDERFVQSEHLMKEWAKIEKHKEIKIHFPKINSRRLKLLEMGYLNLREEVDKYYRKRRLVQEAVA